MPKLSKGDSCPRCHGIVLAVECVLSLDTVRVYRIRHSGSACFSIVGRRGRRLRVHAIVGGDRVNSAGFPVYLFLEGRTR